MIKKALKSANLFKKHILLRYEGSPTQIRESTMTKPLVERSELLLSLIVPVLNEEENLFGFIRQVDLELSEEKNLGLEYIFVDDGSTDNTMNLLLEAMNGDKRIKIFGDSVMRW